jgi:hypothetical protein
MAPKPSGLFKLLALVMAMSTRKGNARALDRLKPGIAGMGAPA